MLFIDNEGITDPQMNLAIEEYALKQLPDSDNYLLFYINEPSIIIGRNQNTLEEINADYVKEQGLHVVRRLSGGGAVYHDLGNLNFSFITQDDGQSFHNYRKFTEPVVAALRKLGVEAELTGRNDIQIGERKISGNAQFTSKGRMFSHGTLLFASEMENVVSALKVNADKIESKGIKSIRSRVANIAEFLPVPLTIEQFRTALLESIFETSAEQIPQYKLTERDWQAIRQLSKERYQNWDWNYGKSPKSTITNSKRFEQTGTVSVHLQIEQGLIAEIKIYGDFFGAGEVSELEDLIRGARYEESEIRDLLANDNLVGHYIGNLQTEAFVSLLFD